MDDRLGDAPARVRRRADPGTDGRPVERSQQLLADVGRTGGFWQLPG